MASNDSASNDSHPDWERYAKILAGALGAIDQVLASSGHRRASAAIGAAGDLLTGIQAIVDAVRSGDLEQLDAETAERELARLRSAISSNDAAADAAVDEKFSQ